MHSYEIEIKSLIGDEDKAAALVSRMQATDPDFKSLGSHKQLNHYFVGGDLKNLFQNLKDHIEKDKLKKFEDITDRAKDFSVRTRLADHDVILVIKASVDDTTSANGTARMEFEARTPDLTLDQLDELVLKSGFSYQAKWSRERKEFKYKGLDVSIDKNAGYGYLAEFEAQIDDPAKAVESKKMVREIMRAIGADELPQDRLERMFAHYNKNWKDYYGTEKTFVID